MVFKAFVDANVLLDFCLQRNEYNRALAIIALAEQSDCLLFTSSAVIHILAFYVAKEYGVLKTKEIIRRLLNYISILDANQQVVIKALDSNLDDIEDAMNYFAAANLGLDFFISRDKRLKSQALLILPVLTPDDFLRMVEEHRKL